MPPDLLALYEKGSSSEAEGREARRQATTGLMEVVNASLSALTVSAPDYETLEFFWTLRRIAKSSLRSGRSASGPMSLDEQVCAALCCAALRAPLLRLRLHDA